MERKLATVEEAVDPGMYALSLINTVSLNICSDKGCLAPCLQCFGIQIQIKCASIEVIQAQRRTSRLLSSLFNTSLAQAQQSFGRSWMLRPFKAASFCVPVEECWVSLGSSHASGSEMKWLGVKS